ncbi:hypothetical protein A0257_11720 [Hymenobacter psoromatis]|nr:hypothetical protein A0257_11720 [Hymenobacter psoromatis]
MKVEVPPEVGRGWTTHPDLTFYTPVNLKTGECAPRSEATFRNLLFTIYPSGRATFEGSLHKLRHGQHNGGPFPAWAVAATIAELAYSFKFRPEQARLRALEFGLNVPLPAPATQLLRRAVLYKTLPFDLSHFGGQGYFLEATAQQYHLKLYDKQRHLAAYHHPATAPLLRVELKTRRTEWLSGAGVATLADLTDPAKLAALGAMLIEALDQVLFAAASIPAGLSKPVRQLLTAGSHPNYWQALRKEHPESLRKQRQRYRELLTQYAPDLLAPAAAAGLAAGWEHLRTAAPCLPHLLKAHPQTIPVLTNCPPAPARPNRPGFNSLSIGVEPATPPVPDVRRCQTCGRDISGQAAGAQYCSEARYGRAAKKCRNAASNPRHNTRRAVQKTVRECSLFDPLPYVRVRPELRAFVLAGAVPTASPSKKS